MATTLRARPLGPQPDLIDYTRAAEGAALARPAGLATDRPHRLRARWERDGAGRLVMRWTDERAEQGAERP